MPSLIRRVKRKEPLRPHIQDPIPHPPPIADSDSEEEPRTPKKQRIQQALALDTPPSTPRGFSTAKACFQRGTSTDKVYGRESERKTLKAFLKEHLDKHSSGTLYLPGLPGSGKTALVREVTSKISSPHIFQASINCMTLDSPSCVFEVLARELKLSAARIARTQAVELLAARFTIPSISNIVVLDEVDSLLVGDQEVLFKLFEWGCQDFSNLIIIGIANSIDLTDRFLPRLQAHKVTPLVLPFKPYTAQDIAHIIEQKLKSLGAGEQLPLLERAAVRIIAAKTAAYSGDLRRAFDVCKRAIDVLENKAVALNETRDALDDPNIIFKVPPLGVAAVARLATQAFGGTNPTAIMKQLSFQHKAVLCAILVEERSRAAQGANQNVSISDVFQAFNRRCRIDQRLLSVSFAEFVEVVTVLEAYGLATVSGMCGQRGMGANASMRSGRGSLSLGSEGWRMEYSLRKLSPKVHLMDLLTAIADTPALRDYVNSSM